jgi:hypothetical protein
MALFYFKPYGNPTQYNFPLNIMHALSIYRVPLRPFKNTFKEITMLLKYPLL